MPYCVATVIREVDPEEVIQTTTLTTFDEVVAHLRETYAWFANRMADFRAAKDYDSNATPIGGFGVKLENQWRAKVQVGVGRDIWFLASQSGPVVTDFPPLNGSLVFFLDGWHHTELERELLVSKARCLTVLRQWFETGELPDGL